jgi:hypothetical protein
MRSLFRRTDRRNGLLAAAVGLTLVVQGCGLDKVQVPDTLVGPAELGTSVRMTATPDSIVADNESSSLIQVTVRDQNGKTVSGKDIVFAILDPEKLTPIGLGQLNTYRTATDSNGIARVTYYSPARTDVTAKLDVFIGARPQGDDAAAAYWRTVKIELYPAEVPLFPPNSGDVPTCTVIRQPNKTSYLVGEQILFQSSVKLGKDAAGNPKPIVRYEWNYADDTAVDTVPDTNHYFRAAGLYTVTLSIIDSRGAAASCASAVTVVAR